MERIHEIIEELCANFLLTYKIVKTIALLQTIAYACAYSNVFSQCKLALDSGTGYCDKASKE